jgi:hypothetical protein
MQMACGSTRVRSGELAQEAGRPGGSSNAVSIWRSNWRQAVLAVLHSVMEGEGQ